jgi:hypothetical protein
MEQLCEVTGNEIKYSHFDGLAEIYMTFDVMKVEL